MTWWRSWVLRPQEEDCPWESGLLMLAERMGTPLYYDPAQCWCKVTVVPAIEQEAAPAGGEDESDRSDSQCQEAYTYMALSVGPVLLRRHDGLWAHGVAVIAEPRPSP